MPLYVSDLLADGKVDAMNTEEFGAYMRLLCRAWHEDPVGSVPDENFVLARWAKMSETRFKNRRAVILAPFTKGEDGRLHQKRMQQEFNAICDSHEKRVEAGRIGAKKRWQCHSRANSKTIAKNSKPESIIQNTDNTKPRSNKRSTRKGAGGGLAWLGFDLISEEMLQDTAALLEWIEQGVEAKLLPPANEIEIVATAMYCAIEPDVHNPVGAFRSLVTNRDWRMRFEQTAKDAIRKARSRLARPLTNGVSDAVSAFARSTSIE